MRKSFSALFILMFALRAYGQETVKAETATISAKQSLPVRSYRGEDYVPYIFEPYRAEYIFKGSIIGLNFNFFNFSTAIAELNDEWQETQKWQLKFPDEELEEIEIVSHIDLKTGLLKKLVARIGDAYSEYVVGDGQIIATAGSGEKKRQISFANREKIYPCSFSNTFLSYLPLNDNFAGSFVCFQPGEDKNGKPTITFHKRTLRVVGTEKITVEGGSFECYKLADETEEIKYNADGSLKAKEKTKPAKQIFDEEKLWKSFYSNSWIDKKTRKFVKGELKFKYGSVAVELLKSKRRFEL